MLRSHDCVYSTSAPLLALITTNTFDISVGDNTFSPRDICFLFVLFIRLLVTYGLLGGFYALLGKMGNWVLTFNLRKYSMCVGVCTCMYIYVCMYVCVYMKRKTLYYLLILFCCSTFGGWCKEGFSSWKFTINGFWNPHLSSPLLSSPLLSSLTMSTCQPSLTKMKTFALSFTDIFGQSLLCEYADLSSNWVSDRESMLPFLSIW